MFEFRCFPVKFAKFLRTPFFTEHLRWLLLDVQWSSRMQRSILCLRSRKLGFSFPSLLRDQPRIFPFCCRCMMLMLRICIAFSMHVLNNFLPKKRMIFLTSFELWYKYLKFYEEISCNKKIGKQSNLSNLELSRGNRFN